MAYVWQALTWILGGGLCALCALLLILIVNLWTFKRLRATPTNREQDQLVANAAHNAHNANQQQPEGVVATPVGQVQVSGYVQRDADPRQPQGIIATRLMTGAVDTEPFVSLLVPARNEEACIEACVRSLVGQNYSALEVLVLDDQSSDSTASLVQSIIDELPAAQKTRLRLLHGTELPVGWIGKNFACQQLAQQAQGAYLLFTDADTLHAPEMARAVLDSIQHAQVQLLTGQPEQVLGSTGEQLIVPLLNFTILTLLPVALIGRRPEPSLATGNGQLLCFERAAYEKIGGHGAVKGLILEDVLLARRMKAAGYRMAFVDAQELVQCRMYHSWPEVWAGFSKNLFAFYNYSLPFASFALMLNLLLFVLPALLLISALLLKVPQTIVLYALGSYLLAVLMRVLLTLRFTRVKYSVTLIYDLLHPVSIMLECLILINAIRWHYRKTGVMWKGRRYA
ncbi:MAG: hydroxychlorobactene glucosyltransferase CruC [Ktedonobacteraceae bacterium]